jgi:hypothetical protein
LKDSQWQPQRGYNSRFCKTRGALVDVGSEAVTNKRWNTTIPYAGTNVHADELTEGRFHPMNASILWKSPSRYIFSFAF